MCLNSSFFGPALHQEHFQAPCGGEAGFLVASLALPGVAGRRPGQAACVFSQPLSEHPLGLSPSCLHLSLSFLERLVELSDENTGHMPGSRPPDQAGWNFPRPDRRRSFRVLLETLPWLLSPPGLKPTLL